MMIVAMMIMSLLGFALDFIEISFVAPPIPLQVDLNSVRHSIKIAQMSGKVRAKVGTLIPAKEIR